jgi:hypothetical protein
MIDLQDIRPSSYTNAYVKDLEQKLKVAIEALELGIKYFEPMEFGRCCNGRDCGCMGVPTDPEYYLMKDMKEALEKLKDK